MEQSEDALILPRIDVGITYEKEAGITLTIEVEGVACLLVMKADECREMGNNLITAAFQADVLQRIAQECETLEEVISVTEPIIPYLGLEV